MFITNSRRYFFVLLCCLQFLYGQSQGSIQPLPGGKREISDSIMTAYNDSLKKADLQKGMENSFRFITEYQQQERKKRQQKMILYFGVGTAMLAVLIYGLRRKQKQPGLVK